MSNRSREVSSALMAGSEYSTKRYWNRLGWAVAIRRRHRTQPVGWNPHISPVLGREPAHQDHDTTRPHIIGVRRLETGCFFFGIDIMG